MGGHLAWPPDPRSAERRRGHLLPGEWEGEDSALVSLEDAGEEVKAVCACGLSIPSGLRGGQPAGAGKGEEGRGGQQSILVGDQGRLSCHQHGGPWGDQAGHGSGGSESLGSGAGPGRFDLTIPPRQSQASPPQGSRSIPGPGLFSSPASYFCGPSHCLCPSPRSQISFLLCQPVTTSGAGA